MTDRSSVRAGAMLALLARRRWDLIAVCVLAALAVWLFRHHVLGDGTYIGNPDRLNSHLKILKFHVDALAFGRLDGWSEFEMLGYDTFTMPYTFPNLETYVASWLGPEHLYVIAGYFSTLLLAVAGISAYAFVRALTGGPSTALVGAILYELSALTVLKVSQNDMSFAVLIVMPLMMLVVLRSRRENATMSFCLLSLLVFLLLHFMFLQKAAYALMLVGAYTVYRTAVRREWRLLAVFAGATLTGIVGAFPRIYGVSVANQQYTRTIPGHDFHVFEDLYNFQAIFPSQILRWLDGTIFGRFPSEAVVAMQNNINLTEGFLLSTSAAVPLLILCGVLRYQARWLRLPIAAGHDARFFFWAFVVGVAAIVVKPVSEAIYLLFLRMDFTHARILIAALLPLVSLVGLLLADLRPVSLRRPSAQEVVLVVLGSLFLAVLAVWAIEAVARSWKGFWPSARVGMRLHRAAMARVVASWLVTATLLAGVALARRRPMIGRLLWGTLCLLIVIQTLVAADFQVNGKHTKAPAVAFDSGNNHMAQPSDFRPPSKVEMRLLHERLEADRYRTALICDPRVAGGFCSGHVPGFWRLRVIDGYYGLGVPARIAALPWPGGAGLRNISFLNRDLPWSLLALLNVKYGVVVDDMLYRNPGPQEGRERGLHRQGDMVIVENPVPAVPRVFFAHSVEPVATVSEAVVGLFKGGGSADVRERSFVEGLSAPRAFVAAGAISLSGHGDRLVISVDPVPADRFLVLNELYFPGWHASVDGAPTVVYPTNAVMRGVLVPAGATTVTLTYVPFVRSGVATIVYIIAAVMFVTGTLLCSRATRR